MHSALMEDNMMLGYRGLLAAAVLGLQTTGSGAAADFIIGGAGKVVDGFGGLTGERVGIGAGV